MFVVTLNKAKFLIARWNEGREQHSAPGVMVL